MGLMPFQFAPKDITPGRFFGEWLATQVEPMKPLLPMLGDAAATMSIRVDGPDGGDWSCSLSKDGLAIKPGLNDDAVVTLVLTTKNFLTAVTGELKMGGPQAAGGKTPSPDQVPKMIENTLAGLRQVNGQLRYRLSDPAGDFIADVKFAGPLKSEPDVEVSMTRETADAISSGSLNPQSAFMAGQVQISGDMNILIQLMPLMMV